MAGGRCRGLSCGNRSDQMRKEIRINREGILGEEDEYLAAGKPGAEIAGTAVVEGCLRDELDPAAGGSSDVYQIVTGG